MEVMILSFIAPSVRSEWNVSSTEESVITTIVFAGMLIGAYSWGAISDNFGRRKGLLSIAIVTSGASLLSAFSSNYISLVVLRCIGRIGLGGGPIYNSCFLEFVPVPSRGRWMVIFATFWTSGTIVDPFLPWEQKETLEKQLHDMAVVVDRLENNRQKLLCEIDSQSCDMEKLSDENSNLTSAYQEATSVGVQWENQIKECLKQNEELRSMIDKLRTEEATIPIGNHHEIMSESNKEGAGWNEIVSLKGQLAQEQRKGETLSAQVLHLSAQLLEVMQAYNCVTRKYKRVLRKSETDLVTMKQGESVAMQ